MGGIISLDTNIQEHYKPSLGSHLGSKMGTDCGEVILETHSGSVEMVNTGSTGIQKDLVHN